MTAILLALVLADGAVTASEYREYKIVEEKDGGDRADPASATHVWAPRVQSWGAEKAGCRAFYEGEIDGFGILRVGPLCTTEHDPVAL
jgi:hypothetical protein